MTTERECDQLLVERVQGGDRQAGRARGSDPVLDHELEAMAGQVRDTIDGLSSLLSDALERKLRLGELLTEAKGRCKPRRGAWTVFLSSCGLNERTAREAIQFVRERATVDAQRHGRAGLTVSEVRIALAKPRKAPLDEQGTDNAEQAEQASLPPPGVVAQLCESVTEPEREPHQGDSASREPATREVDDDVRGETEAGGDPGPDDVERLVDACRRLVEVGDGAIAVLGSAPSAANVASLLELLPLARERLRRVDDALAGILGSG